MTVYFLRHGEYVNKELEPSSQTPLSPQGIATSKRLASKLKHLSISVIFSSELERANETAQIVAKEIGTKVERTTYLNERVKGKESFQDLLKRAIAFVELLRDSDRDVLIVSHSEIFAVIMGYMEFGEKFTEEIHESTKHFLFIHESELIAVEKRKKGWKIAGVDEGT